MAERPDLTTANKLFKVIADLQSEMNEFRTRQPISGRSGVFAYLTQNASTWDLTGTIGADTDTSARTTNFTAKFTGDGTQSPVIANLSFVVWVQMGTSTMQQLTAVNNSFQDGRGRDANLNYNSVVELQTTYTQTFYLITDRKVNYFIKAYAAGSSAGTVTVTSP